MVTAVALGVGYMRTRSVESMLATIMVVAGAILILPGSTFAVSPIWRGMARWITEDHLGAALIACGLGRWLALYYNGRVRETPILRIGGCIMGSMFWSAVAVSFEVWQPSAGVPVMFGVATVFTCFEVYSAFRCGTDASALDSFRIRQRSFREREVERRNVVGRG